MSTVSPLASFLTVVRFSNEARSCASASEINTKNVIRILSARCFIGPPLRLNQAQREEFDVTWGEESCQSSLCWRKNGAARHTAYLWHPSGECFLRSKHRRQESSVKGDRRE